MAIMFPFQPSRFARRAALFAVSLTALCLSAQAAPPAPLIAGVDPLIGTDGGGNTFPGASAPFGMTQFSPDTSDQSIGYTYYDKQIEGFSLTHMSGVGCSDGGDVFLTATTGPVLTKTAEYASPFRHAAEMASPGYYQVRLDKWDVNVELTATERTGLVRFTFPANQTAHILIPLSHTQTRTSDAQIHLVGRDTIEGQVRSKSFCGSSQYSTVFFTLKLDHPFTTCGTWTGATQTDGSRDAVQADKAPGIGAYVTYPAAAQPFAVTARIGISYVDLAGARNNLAREVGAGSFDTVRRQSEQTWETALHKIDVQGGTASQRTVFYTSLYHCLLMPSLFSDTDGRYLGFDNVVHRAKPGHAVYADFSGWDIYRTEAPLLALIEPQRYQDMCQSLSLMYAQGGWIDRWPQANTYTNVMCGSPLTTVAATGWAMGLRDFDMATLYPGMMKDASQPPPPDKPYQGESNVAYMDTLGYIPDDKEGYGSVSQTEEDCLAYAALASVSRSLGKREDAQYLSRRALFYRNLFDPETKFLRPRLLDGSWFGPFDPNQHQGYVEGSGWHYRWLASQDVKGLITLFGGDEAFNAELDKFFSYPKPEWVDQYYTPYNETDLQAPFLYDFSGQPWKTQARVRELLVDAYGTKPNGIPGNDDCGTMSAWFIFAALGLFPADPTRPVYEVCSPLFPRAVVSLSAPYAGRQIVIEAPGASAENAYVHSLTINGKTTPRSWLSATDLTRGAALVFTLDSAPNIAWGSAQADRPPSLSDTVHVANAPTILPAAGHVGDRVTLTAAEPGANIRYTTDGSLPTESSPRYAGPFTLAACGTVKARAYKSGYGQSSVASAFFDKPGSVGTGTGLTGTYFPRKDLTGDKAMRSDSAVNFNFDGGGQGPLPGIGPQNFSARWTGRIEAPLTDTYTFTTVSDDGVRVWVDNKLLLDNWTPHSPTQNTSSPIALEGGRKYDLKIEYFNGDGGGTLQFYWAGGCRRKELVPSSQFYPAPPAAP